jgi:hypothetical protein
MVFDDADLPVNGGDAPEMFRLQAARGEFECVQLVVMLAEPIERVSVESGELAAKSSRLPTTVWKANKVGQVPGHVPTRANAILHSWGPDDFSPTTATDLPDLLLPDATFDLDRGLQLRPFYDNLKSHRINAAGRFTRIRSGGNMSRRRARLSTRSPRRPEQHWGVSIVLHNENAVWRSGDLFQ